MLEKGKVNFDTVLKLKNFREFKLLKKVHLESSQYSNQRSAMSSFFCTYCDLNVFNIISKDFNVLILTKAVICENMLQYVEIKSHLHTPSYISLIYKKKNMISNYMIKLMKLFFVLI